MEYIINSNQTPVISHYANYIVYNPDTQQASLILPTDATKITLNSMLNFAKQIKEIAKKYSETDPELLLCQYGRIAKFNDATWDIAGGKINDKFKTEIDSKFPGFKNIQQVILPNGETLDFPHFWAVLNGLKTGFGDLCGWAGDIVEFAVDLGKNSNAQFPSGGFGDEDWRSDADAYNIYKKAPSNLLETMPNYFTDHLTESQRITLFTADGKTMQQRYSSVGAMQQMTLSTLVNKLGATQTNIQTALTKMQSYLNNNK